MDRSGPNFLVPTELPPAHVCLLQGILASYLRALLRDLQRAERLPDPHAARRQSDACTRLLEGLERGFIAGPDRDACETLRGLVAAADKANNYSAVVAEHNALQGLLHQLEGKRPDGS
jgi:hypothetical protein